MVIVQPAFKDGLWWVVWLHGIVNRMPFATKEEAVKFHDELWEEFR